MEEAKREKEERKVMNAQSGKNVDIDFELMIEKSKFREKLLSPHASGIDLEVHRSPNTVGSVCTEKTHLQKRGTKWGN